MKNLLFVLLVVRSTVRIAMRLLELTLRMLRKRSRRIWHDAIAVLQTSFDESLKVIIKVT